MTAEPPTPNAAARTGGAPQIMNRVTDGLTDRITDGITSPTPGSAGPEPLLHVVLHEPEIPNNTGNIGRTCVATRAMLHLVRPLAFSLDEKALRRAGLDYWPRLGLAEHADWPAYLRATPGARRWLFTTRRGVPAFDAPFAPGDHLVFGKETAGLPDAILDAEPERCLRLPMAPGERSLNVATAACAAVYLALGAMARRGELTLDAEGRLGGIVRR